MACFGDYWLEFQELTELAGPSVITNLLESAFVLSDVALVWLCGGHNRVDTAEISINQLLCC